MLPACLKMLRPQQWTKNVFILLPILFGGVWEFRSGREIFWLSGCAFAAFCAWSSAVYVINDVLDRKADALHPRKKTRPIASGKIQVPMALGIAFLLAVLPAVGLILWQQTGPEWMPKSFFWVPVLGGFYVTNTIIYCVFLKKCVLLDVFSIALGFIFRVLSGCAALGLVPSSWILVCTFSLALYLGFGKRRMEVACLTHESDFRKVLTLYPVEYLNFLLGVSGGVCLISYLLYTLDPGTLKLHQTQALILSVPFVFYGIFRYAQDAMQGKFDGPDEVLLHDRAFLLNGILWSLCVSAILLGRGLGW